MKKFQVPIPPFEYQKDPLPKKKVLRRNQKSLCHNSFLFRKYGCAAECQRIFGNIQF